MAGNFLEGDDDDGSSWPISGSDSGCCSAAGAVRCLEKDGGVEGWRDVGEVRGMVAATCSSCTWVAEVWLKLECGRAGMHNVVWYTGAGGRNWSVVERLAAETGVKLSDCVANVVSAGGRGMAET